MLDGAKTSQAWPGCHVTSGDYQQYIHPGSECWHTWLKESNYFENGSTNHWMCMVYTWLHQDSRILWAWYPFPCLFTQVCLGKRATKNVTGNAKTKINAYKTKFAELQNAFSAEHIVKVELQVSRVVEDVTSLVKNLGMYGINYFS